MKLAEEKEELKQQQEEKRVESKMDTKQKLEEKQAELEELSDRYKRILAEFENYKKEREKKEKVYII